MRATINNIETFKSMSSHIVDYIFSQDGSYVQQLALGEELKVDDPVSALDFMIVLKGELTVVLETTASNQMGQYDQSKSDSTKEKFQSGEAPITSEN